MYVSSDNVLWHVGALVSLVFPDVMVIAPPTPNFFSALYEQTCVGFFFSFACFLMPPTSLSDPASWSKLPR